MFRRKSKIFGLIALAVAFTFMFSAVASAAVPVNLYFKSGDEMVKVDYAKAVSDAQDEDSTLYEAVVEKIGEAEGSGAAVVVETDEGIFLDWQKALMKSARFAEIVDDETYKTAKPEYTKELQVKDGEAIIDDPIGEIVGVSAINANTISVTFEGMEPVEVTLETALVHGQTEVTFSYEEVEYTAELTEAYVDEDVVAAEKLAAAITAAEEAIVALPSVEEVAIADKDAVADAKALVEAVKVLDAEAVVEGEEVIAELEAKIEALIADQDAEELAEAKTAAKAELDAYVDATEYETNAEDLTAAIEAGKEAVDAAETTEDVDAAVVAAKEAIDAIETDAEIAEREAAEALQAATEAVEAVEESLTVVGGKVDELLADAKVKVADLEEGATETLLLEYKLVGVEGKIAAIIKEVKDAGINQAKLAAAINKAPFEGYEADNIVEYANKVATAATTATTIGEIQEAITEVNNDVLADEAEVEAIAAVKALFEEASNHPTNDVDADKLNTDPEVTAEQIATAKDLVNVAVTDADWTTAPTVTGDVDVTAANLDELVKKAEKIFNEANATKLLADIKVAATANNQMKLETLLNQADLTVNDVDGNPVAVDITTDNAEIYAAAIRENTSTNYNQLADFDDVAELVNDINLVTEAIAANEAKVNEYNETAINSADAALKALVAVTPGTPPTLTNGEFVLATEITALETAITDYETAVTEAEAAIGKYEAAVIAAEDYKEVSAVSTALTTTKGQYDALVAQLNPAANGVKTTTVINSTKDTLLGNTGVGDDSNGLLGAVKTAKDAAEGAQALIDAKANYEAAALEADSVNLVIGTGDYAAAKGEFDSPTGATDADKATNLQNKVDALNKTIAVNKAVQEDNAAALANALIAIEAEVTSGTTDFVDLDPTALYEEVAQALIDARVADAVYVDKVAIDGALQGAYSTFDGHLDTLNDDTATNSQLVAAFEYIGIELDLTVAEDRAKLDGYKALLDDANFAGFTSMGAVKTAFNAL